MDSDVFWVAAAGRRMLASGAFPRTNGWSFTAPDHAWVMHEWGFAVPYALGLETWGPRFFALVAVATTIVTAGAVLAAARSVLGGARGAGSALLVWAACFGVFHLTARPFVLALPLAAGMVALAFAPRFGWKHLLGAGVLALAWANLHGSFPVGPALLLLGALERPEARRLRCVAAGLAVGVSFLNPYGTDLHALVWSYVAGDGTFALLREHLVEQRPLWDGGLGFLSPVELLGLGLLAVAAVTALVKDTRRPLRPLVVLALLALAGTRARHASLAAVLGPVLLAPTLALATARLREPAGRRLFGTTLLPAACLGPLALLAVAILGRPAVGPALGGDELAPLLARVPTGGAVSVPFELSGRAAWLGDRRQLRLLYDSRNDCYPADVARLGLALDVGGPELRELRSALRERGTEHLLAFEGSVAQNVVDGAWPREAAAGQLVLYRMSPAHSP
jgi:hypothetical protein